MMSENNEESVIDKIKNYVFPAKKVLDKAGGKAEPVATPSTDTSYLQNIVNQRMKEKVTTKNPLADEIKKCGTSKTCK